MGSPYDINKKKRQTPKKRKEKKKEKRKKKKEKRKKKKEKTCGPLMEKWERKKMRPPKNNQLH